MSMGVTPGETPGSAAAGGAAAAGGGMPSGEGQGAQGSAEGNGTPGSADELRLEVARLRKLAANKAEEAKRHWEAREALAKQYAEVDLDEFKTFQADKQKAEEERARKNAEWDEHKAKLTKRAELAEKKALEVEQAWNTEKIHSAVLAVAAELGAVNAAHLIAVYGNQFKLSEDGKKVVHVSEIDDEGELLTPKAFLEREKAGNGAHLFRTSMKSGSGAESGSSADGAGVVRISMKQYEGRGLEVSRLTEEAKKAGKKVELVD